MKSRLALLALTASLSIAVALPASAAGKTDSDELRLALLDAHVGEPVDHARFQRAAHSYEVLGPRNVLIWETPSRAWLVDLRSSAACRHLDRGFVIGIDTVTESINVRNSYIVAPGGVSCRVEGLRRVDVQAWKAAKREAGIRA